MRRSSGEVPLLTAPMLADAVADAVDTSTAKYLLRAALKKLDEEETREERKQATAHVKAMTELVRRVPRKRKKSPLPSDPPPVCGHGDVGKGPALACRRLVVVDVSVNMYDKFQQSPIFSGRCLLPFLRQSGGHSNYATETGTVVYRCSSRTRLFPCPVLCYDWPSWSRECKNLWSSHRCSSWTRLFSCPVLCLTGRRAGSTGTVRGEDGRHHPSRGAKADLHGPAVSADHGGDRCPCCEKKFFLNVISGADCAAQPYFVAIITPVIHYLMGGLEVDEEFAVGLRLSGHPRSSCGG